jgi:hypothetical protein
MRKYATELVALAPDVILAHSSTGPVFSCSNTASPENGWNCLKRSRPA